MSRVRVVKEIGVVETPRVLQIGGMFDVPPARQSSLSWEFDFDLPEQWNVGLIVGPSGSGKTTVARHLFGDHLIDRWDWPADRSVLDGFSKDLGIKEIVELLSSVGFSSRMRFNSSRNSAFTRAKFEFLVPM